MNIPKKIHYCWFGQNPMPEYATEFIEGWKSLCREYEVIKWDESNFDINAHPYTKSAYDLGLYPFVADYVRLYVLNQCGGIYMDTDVEMIKPLDNLLTNEAFFGLEDADGINTGLIFGSIPRQHNISDLMQEYDNRGTNLKNGEFIRDTCVEIVTSYFLRKGFKQIDKFQMVEKCAIYPTGYFCPQRYGEWKPTITSETYTIHHYFGNWLVGDESNRVRIYRNARIGRKLKKIIGVNNFKNLHSIYKKIQKNNGK